jgi:NTE family protein
VIEVEPTERARGPDYLRFGLKLQSDFKGEGTFNLSAFYNRTWLNRLGAEWRTLAQVGQDPGITTEFYQPLDLAGRFFVAPRAFAGERLWNVFYQDERVAQYQVRQATVGLDIGTQLDRWGELRFGYVAGSGSAYPKIAIPGFPSSEYAIGALRAQLTYDQLDNVNFPTSGALFLGSWYASLNSLGATEQYSQADFKYTQALFSYRAHTLTLGASGGTTYNGQAPPYDQFTLGGFLNLSGYLTGQFAGQDFAFARAVYYYRLYQLPPIADGVFLGGSLEAGNVYDRFDSTSSTGLLYSGSIFVGAETLLGPLYIAYGQAFQGGGTFYIFLGRP